MYQISHCTSAYSFPVDVELGAMEVGVHVTDLDIKLAIQELDAFHLACHSVLACLVHIRGIGTEGICQF